MSDTLARIKAEAENSRNAQTLTNQSRRTKAQRLHEAASPLLKAFADIQNINVRVDVLMRIWPTDYQRRPDKARGLLLGFVGGDSHPCGISLSIPGGRATYQVETTWDDKLIYVEAKETHAAQPRSWIFETPEPWLAGFYQTMSTILEL